MENVTELQKSLVAVIDEAIAEIEDLQKSKFDAQEIEMGEKKSGVKEMDKNGSMAAKADDDKDEDEDKDEMDKADGKNNEADPDKGPFKQSESVGKGEDCEKADDDDDEEEEKKDMDKAEGKNLEADPDAGAFKESATVKKSADEEEGESLSKALEEQEELIKSYVDSKFADLEKTIAAVLESVEALADSPVPAKGVTADGFTALQKSNDETVQPLNKSYVANELFSLKKSGEKVDSADIIKVETGSQNDIAAVANKYGLVKR